MSDNSLAFLSFTFIKILLFPSFFPSPAFGTLDHSHTSFTALIGFDQRVPLLILSHLDHSSHTTLLNVGQGVVHACVRV